jgi:CRISPR-associated protein Csb1
VHGTFLESISGTMRLARALSGFIEARDVQVVASGGVKNDRVSAGTESDSEATAKEGFGNVPFHRDEYTARSLQAFFNLDLTQIRAYGLGGDAERFLVALALWKVRRFLETGLRLRTACDLDLVDLRVKRPDGWTLPERAELEGELKTSIQALAKSEAFGRPPILEVNFEAKPAKKKR